MRRLRLLFAAFLALFPIMSALAEDVGNVALIEDTRGVILPAGNPGMCDIRFANGLCANEAAKAFYKTHGDNYDMLVFFTTKNLAMDVQMGFPVQVAAKGIGLEPNPLWGPKDFGSAGRLRQCVKMGSLPLLPADPNDYVNLPKITGVELMAHEVGHQWLAWVMLDLNDGRGPLGVLRGFESEKPNGHWSCYFNSGSVEYGGRLTDLGNGNFKNIEGPRKYGLLDQYLMGIRSAEEVGELWYFVPPGDEGIEGCPSMPFGGEGAETNYTGTKVTFTVDDIIRANGVRDPASSACHIKFGFGLVYEKGKRPNAAQIAKVDAYRQALEAWWPWGTDTRGSIDTTLTGCGKGTEECPGTESPQCAASKCTNGDLQCSGNLVEECVNQAWTLKEDCGSLANCVNNQCVPITPTDGDEETAQEAEMEDDADEPALDGDDTPVDGDPAVTDGDPDTEAPPVDGDPDTQCRTFNDCPALHRCSITSGACIACPSGTVRVVDNYCISEPQSDGDDTAPAEQGSSGGGCQDTGLPQGSLILLLLFVFFAAARRRRI